MREKGFKSLAQLDEFIRQSADKRPSLQDEIKVLDKKIAALSSTMEQVYTVTKYRQIYEAHKKDSSDKAFAGELKSEIRLYKKPYLNLKNPTIKCQVLKIF